MGYSSGTFLNNGDVGCSQATHTLHVDCNRTDSYTANGSHARPYKTVAEALLAASGILGGTQDEKPGVAVAIEPGNYEEDCSFQFPFPSGRLDVRSVGGAGSAKLRSLEAMPCVVTSGDTRNFLNLHNVILGSETSTVAPLRLHHGGYLHACLWGCRIDLEGKTVPLCEIGDDGGTGAVYAHFYNNCRFTRLNVPVGATTAALECRSGALSSTVDFQGRLRQSGGQVPLVQAGGGVHLDAQDSSFITTSNAPAFNLAGSAQAVIIDSTINSGAQAGIRHTGSYMGDGAMVLIDGVFFYLTTGQAVYAPNGALVAMGSVNWDGALAGYGGIEGKITVADPALLKRLQCAAITGYEPTQTANWNTPPADIKTALDELALRIKALEA